jgi:hypothetical protein
MKIRFIFLLMLSSCSGELPLDLTGASDSTGSTPAETQTIVVPEGVAQSEVQVNTSGTVEQDAECASESNCEIEVVL